MSAVFHLSFVVPDKEVVKRFYQDVVGCDLGRDTANWFDLLFFGHQLTVHQQRNDMPAVALDHFGAVIEKEQWFSLLGRLKQANVTFTTEAKFSNEGTSTESGKFVILDPANNKLEFKYYLDFSATVG